MLCDQYLRIICLVCALVCAQTTSTVSPTVDPTTDVTNGSTAIPTGAVTDGSTLVPTTAVTDGSTLVPTADIQIIVIVDCVTTTTVTLSWIPIDGISIYEIVYTGPNGQEQQASLSFITTITITGLAPGTVYTFRVEASTVTRLRAVGTVTTFTDIEIIVNVDSVTTTTVTLSWIPIDGILFYVIFYTGPNGQEQQASLSFTTTTTITGLIHGTVYTFRVEANTVPGPTVGTVTTFTDIEIIVIVDCVTTTTVTLSWTPIDGISIYVIFYTGPNGQEQQASLSFTTTTTITGLTHGTVYVFRVEASTVTRPRAVGTVITSTDTLQTEVTVETVTQETITISWTLIPCATYLIFYTGPNGQEQQISIVTVTVILTGLNPASQYNIRLQSISPTGQLLQEDTTKASTAEGPLIPDHVLDKIADAVHEDLFQALTYSLGFNADKAEVYEAENNEHKNKGTRRMLQDWHNMTKAEDRALALIKIMIKLGLDEGLKEHLKFY